MASREEKLSQSTGVFGGAGYVNTIVEELTEVGLTIVDTRDVEFINLIIGSLIEASGTEVYTQDLFYQAEKLAGQIRNKYDRKKKIGKVPGKKPKKGSK
jgi:hypothetical protein